MLGDPHEGLCIDLPMYMLEHECARVLLAGTQLWPKLWSWGPGAPPGTVAGVSPTTSWVPGMTSRSSSSPWEGQAVTPEGLSPTPPTIILASPRLPSANSNSELVSLTSFSGNVTEEGVSVRSRSNS